MITKPGEPAESELALMGYSQKHGLYSNVNFKTQQGKSVCFSLPLHEAVSVMKGWVFLGQDNLDSYADLIQRHKLTSGLYLSKKMKDYPGVNLIFV